MPPTPAREFKRALQERSFAPVYYLHGEDDYLKDEAIRRLVDRAVDPATRDFNLEVLRGADVDAGALGSLLDTPPMMAERRVVVVRDVGALRRDARRMLDRYLERPARDAVLVLVAPAGAKPDRDLVDRGAAVEFAPLTPEQLPRWIEHHAAELGVPVTSGAVALLHRAVGNDLPALAAELDKLASYAGDGEIGEAAVATVVGVRRGETLGD